MACSVSLQYDTACSASKRKRADPSLISAYFPTASFCHAGFFRFLIKNAERRGDDDGGGRDGRDGKVT